MIIIRGYTLCLLKNNREDARVVQPPSWPLSVHNVIAINPAKPLYSYIF